MAADVMVRSLICLAKHNVVCAGATRQYLIKRPPSSTYYSTHTSIPDFLLPAFLTRKPAVAPSAHACPALRQHPSTNLSYARHFSASLAPKATVVTANPRKDDDGNEMLIDITARAATVWYMLLTCRQCLLLITDTAP